MLALNSFFTFVLQKGKSFAPRKTPILLDAPHVVERRLLDPLKQFCTECFHFRRFMNALSLDPTTDPNGRWRLMGVSLSILKGCPKLAVSCVLAHEAARPCST